MTMATAGSSHPEGGWGWVVVVGAGLAQMLTLGGGTTAGLFLVEFLEEFQASASATSWTIGLLPLVTGFFMMTRGTANGSHPEGGWGWVVVIGAGLAQMLTIGGGSCLGLFLLEFLEEFQASASATSWIYGLVPLVTGFCSPAANILAQGFGHRQVCMVGAIITASGSIASSFATSLTHLYLLAVMGGIGVACALAPTFVIVGLYFKDKFDVVNAWASTGCSIGQIAFPPVYTFLISFYGWRGAILIIGAMNLNLLISGALYRPVKTIKPTPTSKISETDERTSDENTAPEASRMSQCCAATSTATGIPLLCMKPHFPIVLFTAFVGGITATSISFYIAPRILQHGYSKNHAAILLSCLGAGKILGRFVQGLIFSLKCLSPEMLYLLSMLIGAVALFLFAFIINLAVLCVLAVILGTVSGIYGFLVYVIAREVTLEQLLGPVFGYNVLVIAVGNALGAVVGGLLYDISSDYDTGFYFNGGILLIASIMFLPTTYWINKKKTKCVVV